MGTSRRWETPAPNVVLAGSILLVPFLSFVGPLFPLPEFAPPQVVYSRDLVPLLLAPWASPSSTYRVLSRLLQSALLVLLPNDTVLPCYLFWVAIALSRTLVGFLLSRSVGWAYPRLFNHWALYESSGGCGPPLVANLIASGARPDLAAVLQRLRGYGWGVTDSLVLLVVCTLLAVLDDAPWTYGIAIGLAVLSATCRTVVTAYHPRESTHPHLGPDSHQRSVQNCLRTDVRIAFLSLALILLPNILFAFSFLPGPPTLQVLSSSEDGAPLLEILLLSFPRPNDSPSTPDQDSILTQTIASYLPYVSSSTTLSVFTHANPSTHPAFVNAQQRFEDAPVTFYVDEDTHPDAYEGQYLHLAEAFRWTVEKWPGTSAEWVMLVEDDFPICGEWGWDGVVRVMQELQRGHNTPSPETTKMWGGFVGTGGSGLILHRTLLPILAHTLRFHALTSSSFPAFVARRPADVIIQDCLLGVDPLCPAAPSSKDMFEEIWFTQRRPTIVITSRLVMDHIGGNASTAKGRTYDPGKWRCGWRHPFHGRPGVVVVPVL